MAMINLRPVVNYVAVLLITITAYAQPDRGTFVAERQTMVSEQRVALVIGNADYAPGQPGEVTTLKVAAGSTVIPH